LIWILGFFDTARLPPSKSGLAAITPLEISATTTSRVASRDASSPAVTPVPSPITKPRS
jgi:hypothetical protein